LYLRGFILIGVHFITLTVTLHAMRMWICDRPPTGWSHPSR